MLLGMDRPTFQSFLETLSPSRQPQIFGSDCLTQNLFLGAYCLPAS